MATKFLKFRDRFTLSPTVVGVYLVLWTALDIVSLRFETAPEIQTWYPPSALDIVLLLVFGMRYWPALLLNSVVHTFVVTGRSLPFWTFVVFNVVATAGYALAAFVLVRVLRINPQLRQLRDVVWFVAIAGVVAPFAIGLLQAANFALVDVIPRTQWFVYALTYSAGDATGIAMLAPLLLLLFRRWPQVWVYNKATSSTPVTPDQLPMPLRVLSPVAEGMAIGVVAWVVYGISSPINLDYTYILFLPLLWISVRHGLAGAAAAVLALNVSVAWLVFAGHGEATPQSMQFDLMVISHTCVLLGAVVVDRRETMQRLAEREQVYRTLVETSPDSITLTDAHGVIQFCNPQGAHLIGYNNPNELIGMNAFALIAPPDRERAEKGLSEISEQGRVRALEYHLLKRDGSYLPVEANVSSIQHAAGSYGLICVIRDVSMRKQTEAALTHERNFVSAVLETAGALVCTIDLQGRIISFNRACERTTKYTAEEVRGHILYDLLILPEERERVQHVLQQAARGELPSETENHWRTKNNERRLIAWSNTMLADDEGRVAFVIGTGIDITERRQAEQAIEHSLREKQLLLQEIHHRVKNNLQIIISLFRIQSSYTHDPPTLAVLRESQSRVQSMALVHEKLYQSRTLALIDFADYLRTLAAHLVRSYDSEVRLRRLDIVAENIFLDIDTAIPCGLIVNELMSNSLKHAFPNNHAGEIEVTCRRDENRYTLLICDNGVGVPPNFDPHAVASMGLQLVTTLVRQLGGTISLDGTSGTVWTITFQARREQL